MYKEENNKNKALNIVQFNELQSSFLIADWALSKFGYANF